MLFFIAYRKTIILSMIFYIINSFIEFIYKDFINIYIFWQT